MWLAFGVKLQEFFNMPKILREKKWYRHIRDTVQALTIKYILRKGKNTIKYILKKGKDGLPFMFGETPK